MLLDFERCMSKSNEPSQSSRTGPPIPLLVLPTTELTTDLLFLGGWNIFASG